MLLSEGAYGREIDILIIYPDPSVTQSIFTYSLIYGILCDVQSTGMMTVVDCIPIYRYLDTITLDHSEYIKTTYGEPKE